MEIRGKLFRILDPAGFFKGWITNNQIPPQNTYVPYTRAEVRVAIEGKGFFPDHSKKVDTQPDGSWAIDVPNDWQESFVLKSPHILIYDIKKLLNLGWLSPIYRSAQFQLSSLSNKEKKIYVYCHEMPTEQGISQEQVSKMLDAALPSKVSGSATILEDGIRVHAKRKGAKVSFKIRLRPDTSSDLNSYLASKAEDFDFDLPGPDFLSTICVNEDDIKERIKTAVHDAAHGINDFLRQNLVSQISQSAGIASSLVSTALKDTSITFKGIEYPVVGTTKTNWGLGIITADVHNIVVNPCMGVPRQIR
jgi:hypothetical protein